MKKFSIHISSVFYGDVAIVNNLIGEFSKQDLKSMSFIKSKFKTYLNSTETMTFSFMSVESIKELNKLLPKHYI